MKLSEACNLAIKNIEEDEIPYKNRLRYFHDFVREVYSRSG
jgi:hypothetical protein